MYLEMQPLVGSKGDDFEISKAGFGVGSEIRIITQRWELWGGTCGSKTVSLLLDF